MELVDSIRNVKFFAIDQSSGTRGSTSNAHIFDFAWEWKFINVLLYI